MAALSACKFLLCMNHRCSPKGWYSHGSGSIGSTHAFAVVLKKKFFAEGDKLDEKWLGSFALVD